MLAGLARGTGDRQLSRVAKCEHPLSYLKVFVSLSSLKVSVTQSYLEVSVTLSYLKVSVTLSYLKVPVTPWHGNIG